MSHPISALSAEALQQQLQHLPQWQVHDNTLERQYSSRSYLDGLAKLNAIAQFCETADHHPELILEWAKLTIRFWTHTAKGITDLDFKLAKQVETLLQATEIAL